MGYVSTVLSRIGNTRFNAFRRPSTAPAPNEDESGGIGVRLMKKKR